MMMACALPAVAVTLTAAPGGTGDGGVGGVGGEGLDATVMVRLDVVVVPAAFVARTVKVYVPAVVGVPESTPVLSSKVSPGGSVPLATPKLIGWDGELAAANVYAE